MEPFLIIAGSCGLLAAGLTLADLRHRLRLEKELEAGISTWQSELGKIREVHNTQVQALQEVTDRLGGLEMHVKGVKR